MNTRLTKLKRITQLSGQELNYIVQIGEERKPICECSDDELSFLIAELERRKWQGTDPDPDTGIDNKKFLLRDGYSLPHNYSRQSAASRQPFQK